MALFPKVGPGDGCRVITGRRRSTTLIACATSSICRTTLTHRHHTLLRKTSSPSVRPRKSKTCGRPRQDRDGERGNVSLHREISRQVKPAPRHACISRGFLGFGSATARSELERTPVFHITESWTRYGSPPGRERSNNTGRIAYPRSPRLQVLIARTARIPCTTRVSGKPPDVAR
jgi:hypothetical protein